MHGIPPSNIGPLSNGLNPILFPSGEPLIPLGPSKPRFFDRFKFLNRRPPFNQFFLRRPSKLGCVSFWHIARIAVVVLLMVTLLFNFDPLKGVLNVESAEKRASAENATLALEKANTERERELMAHERESWEKAREARAPQGAFWNEVWPAWDCRAYGKREYWGSLRNIPKGWDAMDACMNMPVEIKGVKIRRPDRCARVFVFPEVQVQGFWVVDWDQPDCKAWYHNFEDKAGPYFSFSLAVHSSLNRDARVPSSENVKSKPRSWASTTRGDKIGGSCASPLRWSGT